MVIPVQFILSCSLLLADPTSEEEKTRYVRPDPKGFASECAFTINQSKKSWTISSVTHRGQTKLAMKSEYDELDKLTSAAVTLTTGTEKKTLQVEIKDGIALVTRPDQKTQEFELAKGVIVTSAPDWTDIFLLCRRYDRKKGGTQSFPGLWIHPVQAAQALTFAIEKVGEDDIMVDGKKQTLDRFQIRLRGGSLYQVWADAKGHMLKLIPLPYKGNNSGCIFREGLEKALMGLKPP